MKSVPFYSNTPDNNQCMVSVYRAILEYCLKRSFTQDEVRRFVGYKKRASWTILPLTKMVDMNLDIRMIEPFDYRAYEERGKSYLEEVFPKDKADWLIAHSNILDIQQYIPDFLDKVQWENRRATLQDIDNMLTEGRLVFVTLNAQRLNDRDGYVDHAILVIDRKDKDYIIHDPGLPPTPYCAVKRQKLWEAMGGDDHTSEVTGFKRKTNVGLRLDQYAVEQKPELSRAFVAKLIEKGDVQVNNAPSKPGYKIKKGDTITINYEVPDAQALPQIQLDVIYEDSDCIVIDKPIGILTHSKGGFNNEATVATWLRSRTKNLHGERAGIVHRLDRTTSGVMICAKTPQALSWLQKQFSARQAQKTYYAVIVGHMPHEHAIIDMPIMRNPRRPQTFRADTNGKVATTEYRVIQKNESHSLLELRPKTGRTHQLRVHLSEVGHPIVGDTLYGGPNADRLYLHAEQLTLTLPNRTKKTFTVKLPAAFQALMES